MIGKVDIDIYDCAAYFAWETDEEELKTFFKKEGVSKEEEDMILMNFRNNIAGAFSGSFKDTDAITVFTRRTDRSVAHEIFHLCHIIMTQRGIYDEEAWAYLIGFLTVNFYDLKHDATLKFSQTNEQE